MEKVFALEVSIDIEKKQLSTRVGYNKDDFFEDDFKLIETAGKEFCQLVGMAYMGKLQEKKEDA